MGLSLALQLEARDSHSSTDLTSTVLAISRIPYGRPSSQSPEAVLADWRGTCSTKHLLLAAIVRECWPELDVQLWHRVYPVTKELAFDKWGPQVAEIVPESGLVDVHTYATIRQGSQRITVDVTFPLDHWDGAMAIPLACADGVDYPAGPNLLAEKANLVETFCNPELRELFIAALAQVEAQPHSSGKPGHDGTQGSASSPTRASTNWRAVRPERPR